MNTFPICRLSATIVLFVFVGCLFAGCGGDRQLPDRVIVSGTVTLDGEPLKKGSISFGSSEDIASGLAASADIVDGKYELKVTSGEKVVKINCFVKGGDSEINAEYAELIPDKYNTNTTLTATVGADSTEFNFPLEK